jgi:hypothetical protein
VKSSKRWRALATVAGILAWAALAQASPVTQTFPIDVDTYLDSQSPTVNYGLSGTTKVVVNGNDGSLTRGLFQVPTAAWAIPASDPISAKVWFWTFKDNTGSRNVRLEPLTRPFSETGATWQTADGVTSWTSLGGDFDAATGVDAVKGVNWFSWDITPLWDNSDLRSFGAILRMNDETNPGTGNMPRAPFNSSDNTASQPYVEVTYAPEPGALFGFLAGVAWLARRRTS